MAKESKSGDRDKMRDRVAKLVRKTKECLASPEMQQITFAGSYFPDELSAVIYLLDKLSKSKHFRDTAITNSFQVMHDLLKNASELPLGIHTKDRDGKVRELKDTFVHCLLPLVFEGPLMMPQFDFDNMSELKSDGLSTDDVADHDALDAHANEGDVADENTADQPRDGDDVDGEDGDRRKQSIDDDGTTYSTNFEEGSVYDDNMDFNASNFSSEDARVRAMQERQRKSVMDEYFREKARLEKRAESAARQSNLNYNASRTSGTSSVPADQVLYVGAYKKEVLGLMEKSNPTANDVGKPAKYAAVNRAKLQMVGTSVFNSAALHKLVMGTIEVSADVKLSKIDDGAEYDAEIESKVQDNVYNVVHALDTALYVVLIKHLAGKDYQKYTSTDDVRGILTFCVEAERIGTSAAARVQPGSGLTITTSVNVTSLCPLDADLSLKTMFKYYKGMMDDVTGHIDLMCHRLDLIPTDCDEFGFHNDARILMMQLILFAECQCKVLTSVDTRVDMPVVIDNYKLLQQTFSASDSGKRALASSAVAKLPVPKLVFEEFCEKFEFKSKDAAAKVCTHLRNATHDVKRKLHINTLSINALKGGKPKGSKPHFSSVTCEDLKNSLRHFLDHCKKSSGFSVMTDAPFTGSDTNLVDILVNHGYKESDVMNSLNALTRVAVMNACRKRDVPCTGLIKQSKNYGDLAHGETTRNFVVNFLSEAEAKQKPKKKKYKKKK